MTTFANRFTVRAVALDAMGVIFPIADDLRSLLIPFLRSRGCSLTDEAIIRLYRSCYRDGAPVSRLWEQAGFTRTKALEDEFLALYEVSPGVLGFLQAMQAASIPVFGLSNDIIEWSLRRREMNNLDPYFAAWVVSGEVKATKPQPEIYSHLVGLLPCESGDCLFVDDRPENLDGARAAGLHPVVFSGQRHTAYESVSSFDQLTELVLPSRSR